MNREQMMDWLKVDKNSIQIHTPNEFFEQLDTLEFKSWKHKGFAYSYYYLCDYIYRHTLYSTTPMKYCQDIILKSLVSNPTPITYITKRNGLLEKLNYIKTDSNFPISFYFENDILEFSMYKDVKKEFSDQMYDLGVNYSIKVPLMALNRFGEDFTGTYYSKQNTHIVPTNVFVSIVTDSKLGYTGVYLYAYLRMMCDKFSNGYQISNKSLASVLGCNERTVARYTKDLEEKGYISSTRKILEYKALEKIYKIEK